MIEPLYDFDNLYESFRKVRSVSGWKERTQRYNEDLVFNLCDLRKRLVEGKYRPGVPNEFVLRERGKIRQIESYNIEDRIVQRCFTQYVLTPLVRPKLIYDNDASLVGRGTTHFRDRLAYKLRDFARLHGNHGYVLLGDFSKFFDNIHHSVLLRCLEEMGADRDVLRFTKLILDAHKVDVSYMSDEEYAHCMEIPFNAYEYAKIDKSKLDGSKMMAKSVGIGSHLAQLAGIVVPYRLDNYIKIVKGLKYYGRYNDDFYVIHEDKEFLKDLLVDIDEICKSLGIMLNRKKTQIIPLRHRFSILQTQYFIRDDGKLVQIPSKKGYKRERDKLRGLARRYKRGQISFDKVQNMYKSWRFNVITRHGTKRSIESVDALFLKLFGKPYDAVVPVGRIRRKDLFNWYTGDMEDPNVFDQTGRRNCHSKPGTEREQLYLTG